NDDKGDDISITDIPEDMVDDAELYRTELVEKICELDDDLMMMYLDGEEPSTEELKAVLRKATCECQAVPVCCGTAYRNKGVQKLLDAVIEFMPSPLDIPAIKGVDEDGNEVERHSLDEEPFSALAFKIMTDPFVGKLAYFRVYSGTCNSGSYVLNATKGKKERVGRILQMHANKREELDKVYSGDIAAAIGFKFTTTGDTICDEQHPVILESMEFPEPVIELAIEPKTKASQGKLGESLAKLAEEDPTFRAHTDQETGQTIIAGMGELHLEIIVDRLLREFKVEANVGAPQVAYKEAFTKAVDIDSKYAKQSGGRGQYGHCKVKFEPMDINGEETFKFESTVVGGAIPKEYIPAVGEGIEEAMRAGTLGGFPVVGVKANVYDGSYHEVDSSEMAFHIAGSLAFKDAMKKAEPVLCEPIMRVEVTMPEEYMGDVIGDINSRRGRIEGMDDLGGGKIVRGFVPLSEMFGYSTDLRSRTQGRGNYSMFFEKYEPVPKSVQEKILSNKN
ncbi:MAG: elongation factor G, partial [Agathobacter sp.]|nr:elongation factor G [Agathobacter sp.]